MGDNGYGNTIVVETLIDWERQYISYSHLDSINVKKGDKVATGQIIGKTGNTGNAKELTSQENHLHFEIRDKIYPVKGLTGRENPKDYLKPNAAQKNDQTGK